MTISPPFWPRLHRRRHRPAPRWLRHAERHPTEAPPLAQGAGPLRAPPPPRLDPEGVSQGGTGLPARAVEVRQRRGSRSGRGARSLLPGLPSRSRSVLSSRETPHVNTSKSAGNLFRLSSLAKLAVSLRSRSPRPVRTSDNDVCGEFPVLILAVRGSPPSLPCGPNARAARAPRCVGSSRRSAPPGSSGSQARSRFVLVKPSSEPSTPQSRPAGSVRSPGRAPAFAPCVDSHWLGPSPLHMTDPSPGG